MARNFDTASNHRIEIASLSDYSTQLSFSVWVNPTTDPSAAQFYTMFSHASGPPESRNMDIDYRRRSGVQHVEISWTQPIGSYIEWVVSTGFTLLLGVWHHIAFAIDWTTNPDSVSMWIDGAAQTMSFVGSDNATPTATGTPLFDRIGSYADSANSAWDGSIAELASWPGYLLTDGEALALSKGFAPFVVHPAGLEIYPQLIREVIDYKGTALTNQGSTAGDHPPVIYAG